MLSAIFAASLLTTMALLYRFEDEGQAELYSV